MTPEQEATLIARCAALEAIALKYMQLYSCTNAFYWPTDEENKANLEREIQRHLSLAN